MYIKKEAFNEFPFESKVKWLTYVDISNTQVTGKEFLELLPYTTIKFCINVAHCKFPTLVDVHKVRKNNNNAPPVLYARAKQDQM